MQTVKLHPKLFLGYSELQDGNIDKRFSPPDVFKDNRKNLFKSFNFSQHQLVEGQQTHSDRVLKLDPENTKMWRGQNIIGVDGFVTKETDVFLMARVADCTPLVLYDPANHCAGLIHAGFKGTLKNIHLIALERMVKDFATNPAGVLAWFGPAALHGTYQTADDFRVSQDLAWKEFVTPKNGSWSVDFVGYQTATLKGAGVLKKNMTFSPRCTVTDPELFSHTRAKQTQEPEGRFAVVVKLL